MKEPPSTYRGPLRLDQIAAGMESARKNALRLRDDAQVMLELGRLPTAFALAALAIEEVGKIPILRQMIDAEPAERKRLWGEFTAHTAKNLIWPVMDLAHQQIARSGKVRIHDLRPAYEQGSTHPRALDQNKQLALYTDCIGGGSWSLPSEYIEKADAEDLVRIAFLLTEAIEHREFCERELELWREAFGSSPEQKVVSWYAAMQAEGLAPAGINLMNEFVNHGLPANVVDAPNGGDLAERLRALLRSRR